MNGQPKAEQKKMCQQMRFTLPGIYLIAVTFKTDGFGACHGCNSRKNKFPIGGVMMRLLFIPSSAMP